MNADCRKKNKSTPIPPRHITSTDTNNGFDSNGLELNNVDGGTKLEISQPPINGLENPSFLPSNSRAGTSNVTPICNDHIPAPHPVGVSTAVVPASASTIAAAGQCNQPLLSPLSLDPEADSNEEALSLACSGGKEETVDLLLSKGTYIEHRDKKGLTPLMLAATAGHKKVVEVLLNHGANIEAQDEKTKDTALVLASSGGHFKVVELLLKRGAIKENHNLIDYTPLTMAASKGHVDIIKLLLANDAEINSRTDSRQGLTPLMMAAKSGHVEAVRILLEMGSDINAIFETDRNTALTLACYYGKQEVVQILLEKKANVEQRTKQGFTPLQVSASLGYAEVARVLIDYGADVNSSTTKTRNSALTFASVKGLLQLVEMLLKYGALVDVKNKKGNSALWFAAFGGHLQIVELLYNAKANIDLKNNREVSCLMAAFRKGHVKLVEWMVERVTQFPSDEEVSRIITSTIDKDLLSKYQLCKELIYAAKDRQAAEANKNAAYLLKELEMEKERKDLKRAAAAKKKEKKKQKKQEKRQADGGSIDSNFHDQDKDNDDEEGKSFTGLKTANPTPTMINILETEDGQSEKSSKSFNSETATSGVTDSSKRKHCTKFQIQLEQTKKSLLPLHVETNLEVDDSQKLSKRGNKRNKENVSSNTAQHLTRCTNEPSSNLIKSLTSTSITSPKKPTKKEEEWKEVVRRKPLSSQENSGSVAGTTKKSQPGDQSSATLSIIHSSERCKKLIVPSNAIGRVIGQAGCNINAIREVSGTLVEIEKPRKGQNHRAVIIKGMPEYISQAQRLISVLIKEPEKKFSELLTEFKAGGTDFSTQECTSLNKNATGTTIGPLQSSKETRTPTITPSTPPPLHIMNAVAPSSSQPMVATIVTSASIPMSTMQNCQHPVVSGLLTSAVKMSEKPSSPTSPLPSNMNVWDFTSLPMVATSVAGMSAPTSRPNSTSLDQDTSPFNRPLSKAEGTSMPGIYTSGLPINVMDTAQDNSINETPTYLDSSSSIPSSGSVKAPVGSRPLLLESPLRSGSPTLANPFLIQPSKPVGNYYSPPPPPPTSIPESGMKVKDPPASTASLDPGGASASKTRKRRKRPHKKNQHRLPQFHEVGRPSTGRLGLQYPPMFGGGASSLSIIPAYFGSSPGMHGRPTDGVDMLKPPHHVPKLKFGSDYPVPIRTSYYDKQLKMSHLGPGLGSSMTNCMSDSSPNELGFLDVFTKYQRALVATNTICRACYGSITGTSFRCVLCKDYNMCSVCVTSGKHPQHPIVRTMDSTVDSDTMAASLTSMKGDSATTALFEKLMVKIAEQDVKIKEQDAKIKENDAEIEHLVSARSEAVALLSQPFDRSPKKKKASQGLL